MTPPLVTSLNLQLKGVHPSMRLAGNIVLGMELEHLKRKLGYSGEGSWHAYREESKSGERPKWVDYCKVQAGITEVSARNYYECAEALKQRLVMLHRAKGTKHLLKQMKKVPSEMSEEKRRMMVDDISGWVADWSQALMVAQFRASKITPADLNAVKGIPEDQAEIHLNQRAHERVGKVMRKEAKRRQEAEQRKALMGVAPRAVRMIREGSIKFDI